METLEIKTVDLVKSYGKKTVVDRVSISVRTGEIVGLLGPNGAGKTTTFKMVVGFTRPDSGRVEFAGKDVSALAIHERARLGVSYLPQEVSVFKKLTVRENIKAVLEPRGLSRGTIRDTADRLIEELGLEAVERQETWSLSGGERRRAEIARALALEPKFIFLDEPFAQVDPKTVEELQAIIRKLRERNLGILITDHNVRETLYITDRSYLMHEGKVLASGTVQDIAANEAIREKYITDRIVRDLLADRGEDLSGRN